MREYLFYKNDSIKNAEIEVKIMIGEDIKHKHQVIKELIEMFAELCASRSEIYDLEED